jgi:hypothetical protein
MARRADPRQIAKLVQVQHARLAIANAALVEAHEREVLARRARDTARKDALDASDDWSSFLSAPGFAPEYAYGLAARMLNREAVADEAGGRLEVAEAEHRHRQHGWRLCQALVKLTDASLGRARRAAARTRDEKRLGELSDRITFSWMRS